MASILAERRARATAGPLANRESRTRANEAPPGLRSDVRAVQVASSPASRRVQPTPGHFSAAVLRPAVAPLLSPCREVGWLQP